MAFLRTTLFVALFLMACAHAQPAATVELSKSGSVTVNQPFASATVTVEHTTNLLTGEWLPVWNVLTYGPTVSVPAPLTNAAGYFRLTLMDTTTNPPGMRAVPKGYFEMGDTYAEITASARPAHLVSVSAFYIDEFEVTNQKMRDALQWAYDHGRVTSDTRLVKSTEGAKVTLMDLHRDDYATNSTRYWSGISFTNGVFSVIPERANQPCIDVSWYGAAAYSAFRSEMEGLQPCFELAGFSCDFSRNGYRLPTEAEWEKAARGGLTGHHYPWSSYGGVFGSHITTNMANYTPPTLPHPFNMKTVGFYDGVQNAPAPNMENGYGLYDMAGNAREWCYDWYDAGWYSQPGALLPDTVGPATGTERVTRGGSFDLGPKDLRVGVRTSQVPAIATAASWYNGFRCVRRP